MAPRANWDKLIPAFDFGKWSEVGARAELAELHFPILTTFYGNPLSDYLPTDVVQELVSIAFKETEVLVSVKVAALQTHIKISDSANCVRLANELLMITSNKDSPAVFLAEFVRDLLAKWACSGPPKASQKKVFNRLVQNVEFRVLLYLEGVSRARRAKAKNMDLAQMLC